MDPLDVAWSGWREDPCGTIALDRACGEEPRLREVMKWNDRDHRYVRCDLMICTEPMKVKHTQVFGIFVVDVEAIRTRHPKPIEQDFLVRAKQIGSSPTVYYSGQPGDHPLRASGFWQDMEEFCKRVGYTGYGCTQAGKRWISLDHHLPIDAPLFDSQPGIRAAIDRAIEHARTIIELRAMGAMDRAPKRPWAGD